MCGDASQPSVSAYMRNLKTPMPWSRKLKLIGRNNWIKITRLQSCCGHPGEPGC